MFFLPHLLLDVTAGEVPIAFVVLNPNNKLKETELIAFVNSQVSPYKQLRGVIIVDSIPRSLSGKVSFLKCILITFLIMLIFLDEYSKLNLPKQSCNNNKNQFKQNIYLYQLQKIIIKQQHI